MMRKTTILIALTLCLTSLLPAQAGASEFNQAVAAYNSGNYAQSLGQFKALATKYPGSELVHYYLALCNQAMGQIGLAKQEYQWVLDHGKSNLKVQAQKGISQLGASRGGTSHQSASASLPASGAAGSSQAKARRVIEFYADW